MRHSKVAVEYFVISSIEMSYEIELLFEGISIMIWYMISGGNYMIYYQGKEYTICISSVGKNRC